MMPRPLAGNPKTCPSAGTGSAILRESVVHAFSQTEKKGREHEKKAEQRRRDRMREQDMRRELMRERER